MTNRTATTAAIILSLAAAGAPAASAMPAYYYAPTGKQTPAGVYDRPDREMIPLSAPSGGNVTPAPVPPAVVRAQGPKSGSDWEDAGIGAAGLALSVIGVGGAFAVSRRRNRGSIAVPS